MTRQNERKLNHFMVSAPSGVVLTSAWLEEHGISSKLAWWYVRTGLLERLGSKAYKKTNDNISWAGVIAALQDQLKIPIQVGGKTALEILGRAHFIPQVMNVVTLFTNLEARIPKWFTVNRWSNTQFQVTKTNSLFKTTDKKLGIIEKSIDGLSVKISAPERAIMEVLFLCDDQAAFNEALLLMENLGQLRPTVVQQLLEHCHSIKVKRLFLFLAEHSQHPWLAKLDLNKINLGNGKRVISGGGNYNAKYMLSLPKITEE